MSCRCRSYFMAAKHRKQESNRISIYELWRPIDIEWFNLMGFRRTGTCLADGSIVGRKKPGRRSIDREAVDTDTTYSCKSRRLPKIDRDTECSCLLYVFFPSFLKVRVFHGSIALDIVLRT